MASLKRENGEVAAAGGGRSGTAPLRSANNVQELYSWVRAAILNGRIGAGETINQAQLAIELGVSRTPLREALRMLQAEGLVVGELNQKMRVAALTAEEIDSLYAARILLEAFGLSLTVPRLTAGELGTIQKALKYMSAHNWTGDRAAWEIQHNAFHGLLVMHLATVLGPTIAETVASFQLRAERYRRIYVSSDPTASAVAAADHARIVDAVAKRAVTPAVHALADHLARTALRLLYFKAPSFKPKAVNNALDLVKKQGIGDTVAIALAADGRLLPTVDRDVEHPIGP